MSVEGLLDRMKKLGVRIALERGGLTIRARAGVITPDLKEEITAHKAEVLDILGRVAIAEYDRQERRLTDLVDAAIQAETVGDTAGAERLAAEYTALRNGDYRESVRRMRALPRSVRIGFGPVWCSGLPATGLGDLTCRVCGSRVFWRRDDGRLMCGVCQPDP